MCSEAKIDMNGRRFTNLSGKVTCATTFYESGQVDEQAIMSRTGHCTEVLQYQNINVQAIRCCKMSQMPCNRQCQAKILWRNVHQRRKMSRKEVCEGRGKELSSNRKLKFTLKRGETTLTLHFD